MPLKSLRKWESRHKSWIPGQARNDECWRPPKVISSCSFKIALKRNLDRYFHDPSQYFYAPGGSTNHLWATLFHHLLQTGRGSVFGSLRYGWILTSKIWENYFMMSRGETGRYLPLQNDRDRANLTNSRTRPDFSRKGLNIATF